MKTREQGSPLLGYFLSFIGGVLCTSILLASATALAILMRH